MSLRPTDSTSRAVKYCDCDAAQRVGWFGGAAACRGENFAIKVARVGGVRDQPWPAMPKTRAIALRWVSDLTRDQRLANTLAGIVETYAARHWDQLRRAPDFVRRWTAFSYPKKKT